MSSILDVSSMYDNYSSTITGAASNKVSGSIGSINENSSDEKLMEACKSFESYFVQKMIEEAKKTLDNEDEQGEYMRYFSDMMNQQYADTVTESGQMGLAQQLYESLKTQYSL